MKIGVIAYGKGGAMLADKLKKLEGAGSKQIIESILVFETYSGARKYYNNIDVRENDDEYFVMYGKEMFNGKGTGARGKRGLEVAENTRGSITKFFALNQSIDDLDAVVIMCAAGGGTGIGATVAARHLANKYPDKPLYGVTVLPDTDEQSTYRLNAGETLIRLSMDTDTVFVFDNNKYGIGEPGAHPEYPDDMDHDDVFDDANAEMMEALHTVLSADQARDRGREGAVINTATLHDVLRTGGITTISSVKDRLPRRDRTVTRWFWKLFPVGTKSLSERRTTVPAFPDSDFEHDTADANGSDGRVIPHPLDLLPFTHESSASFLPGTTPETAYRSAYFLCAPKRYVTKENALAASEWVRENTGDGDRAVKLYPGYSNSESKAVCVHSHTTVPPRIEELKQDYEEINARVKNQGSGTGAGGSGPGETNPKDVNVFGYEHY